jgi:hypothetical protein
MRLHGGIETYLLRALEKEERNLEHLILQELVVMWGMGMVRLKEVQKLMQ